MGVIVFVSYSHKDSNKFRISEISKKLTNFSEIEDVLYYEEHMKYNMITFMNENIKLCDIMLLFCSPNALESGPVKTEWNAAKAINKPIIPIFTNENDIPTLLRSIYGVYFDENNFEETIERIHKQILNIFDIPIRKIDVGEDVQFVLKYKNYNARMIVKSDNNFVVLQDSVLIREISEKNKGLFRSVQELRKELLEDEKLKPFNNNYDLLEDQSFTSPTAAAFFVLGYRVAGGKVWRYENKKLEDYYVKV